MSVLCDVKTGESNPQPEDFKSPKFNQEDALILKRSPFPSTFRNLLLFICYSRTLNNIRHISSIVFLYGSWIKISCERGFLLTAIISKQPAHQHKIFQCNFSSSEFGLCCSF
uniref:Uncharacterized protein n=1 Tax=Cacopsylla melanoneura TaxID=428564 RepID=A0A8D8ZBJ7_9HEMI